MISELCTPVSSLSCLAILQAQEPEEETIKGIVYATFCHNYTHTHTYTSAGLPNTQMPGVWTTTLLTNNL